MNRSLVSVVVAVAAILAGGRLLSGSATPPTVARSPLAGVGASRCSANSASAGGAVVRLTGADARSEMDRIIAADPALAASLVKDAQRFAQAGAKPTGQWTVVRVGTDKGGIRPVQNGQVWAGVNTIAWYSYDDGDWNTWKGTVYLGNSTTGEAGTWAQQTDVSSAATLMRPIWTVSTYWHEQSMRGPASWLGPDLAKTFHLSLVSRPDPGKPVHRAPDFYGYYGCAFSWCAGSAVGCAIAAGPGAPGCFVGACTTALIGCSWGTLWG